MDGSFFNIDRPRESAGSLDQVTTKTVETTVTCRNLPEPGE